MDLKFDILKHPDVRLTTDGKADPYIHGEPWDAGPSIELVYDPKLIEAATENAKQIELPETEYELLSVPAMHMRRATRSARSTS